MAIEVRKPTDIVTPSDHGTQFTSWAFTSRVREAGLVGSMGTIGDGYGTAMIESFWCKLHVGLLNRKKWRAWLEPAKSIFEYIEFYYNRSRWHSALNWDSPTVFEAKERQGNISA